MAQTLKKEFEAMGITRCEVCQGTFALSFAHRSKRRFITDGEELRVVALLCQIHHDEIEHSGHEQMKLAIDKIISSRADQLHVTEF
jgi:hypothetical protein